MKITALPLRATWFLLLLLIGCADSRPSQSVDQPATAASKRHAPVLLVSIDGFRDDYLQRGKTPTLAALAADGVRAEYMQPSFPTLTFPNHYSIVTGLYPDHHGIVHNSMYDQDLGRFSIGRDQAVGDGRWWSGGEPIWVSADKQGLRTATMFWPGSEAEIHGYRPDYWLRYDGKVTASQRVDQIIEWLDLPASQRPDFLTLYFDAVDHAGHAAGPESAQVDGALQHVDKALARLVEKLKQRDLYDDINIIIVSDHGMAASPPDQVIRMDTLMDLDHVYIASMGVLAGFTPKSGHADDVAAALLVPHAHMRCWRKSDVPARLHYGTHPRIPPLLCLADVGWQISSTEYLKNRSRPLPHGQHGYDNADPSMRAIFIAHGPAFRSDAVVPAFPNVDVYPLLTHLLGIDAEPNDGDFGAVSGMLARNESHRTFESERYGFRIDYPATITPSTDFSSGYFANDAWKTYADPGSVGTPLLALQLPRSNAVTSAELRIGVSESEHETRQCTALPDSTREGTARRAKIGAADFTYFEAADAGMSHYLEVHSYRTLHDARCYAIDLLVFGTRPEVYDPPATPPFTNKQAFKRLQQILQGFRFMPADWR